MRSSQQGNDWLSPTVVVGMLRLCDMLVVLLAALLAYLTRFHDFDKFGALEVYGGVLAVLLTTNIFQLVGLYNFNQITNLFGQSGRLLLTWTAVILALLALGFMTKAPLEATSRLWVGLWFVYGFFGLFTARMLFKHQVQRWQHGGRIARNLVVVGAGSHGERLIEHLTRHGNSADRIVGVFHDGHDPLPATVAGLPIEGGISDLMRFARANAIDQVLVALPCEDEGRILKLMKRLRNLPVDVRLCPDMIGFHLPHRQVSHIGGVPMLNVFEKPLAGWSYIVKTAEDRLLAAAILVLILPLVLLLSTPDQAGQPRAGDLPPEALRLQQRGHRRPQIPHHVRRSMHRTPASPKRPSTTRASPASAVSSGAPRSTSCRSS